MREKERDGAVGFWYILCFWQCFFFICVHCIPYTRCRRIQIEASGELKWHLSIVIYVQCKTSKPATESKTNGDTKQRCDYIDLSAERERTDRHTKNSKNRAIDTHTIQKHIETMQEAVLPSSVD